MPSPTVLQQSQLRAVVPRDARGQTGSSALGHTTACRCEICTCGTHKCKVQKDLTTHYDAAYLQTTNAAEYGRKSGAPAVSAAPKRAYEPSPAKFSGQSEYSSAHHGERGAAATPFVPSGSNTTINPGNERFFESENRSEYGNKGYNKREGFKPKNAVASSVPFSGETSNKADYQQWEGAKPSTPFRAKNELQTAPESRDFQSEASLRYVSHPYSKQQAIKPATSAQNPAKFEGQSTSSADYQQWTAAKAAEPFRPVGQALVTAETRDFQSESRTEYGRKNAAPAVSAAPKRAYEPSPAKFSGQSEYSSAHHGERGAAATPFVPSGSNTTINPGNERFFESENRSEYGNKGYNKREGFKPKNAVASSVPFSGETSNKADYQQWEGAKPSTPFRAKNELQTAPESRDFQSEASLRYVSHPYSKQQAIKPATSAQNPAKFEGQSTSSADYQQWTAAKAAEPFRPVGQALVTAETRDFQSESRTEYGRKNAAPAVSAAPKRAYEPSPAKFSGQSEYSSAHHGERGAAATPFVPSGSNTTINPGNERFFESENRSEYGNKGYNKREGFKPKNAVASSVPFSGETSNKADYQQWEGAKPSTPFRAKNELQTAPESRDFQSEASLRYVSHPYSKQQAIKPATSAQNPAKFEGQSTSSADYQQWTAAKAAEPFRPVGQALVTAETRDFQSESRTEYGRKNAAPAVSAAPKRAYEPSPAKFSGQSEYSSAHHGERGAAATPFVPSGSNTTINPGNERFFESENRSEYGNKGYNKREGFKPKNAVASSVPFSGETSNKADYQQWEGAKPSTPFRAKNELQTAPESRDFQSEASLRYVSHPYSKQQAIKPATSAQNPAKFEGQSTNQSDYRDYVFAPCPASPLSDNTQKLPNGHSVYEQTPRGHWHTIG